MEEMDKVAEFVGVIAADFDNGDSELALERVFDDMNTNIIQWSCLEIFHILGPKLLDGTLKEKDPNAWNSAESIFEYITKTCKPREVLIGLLDLLEQTSSDHFFNLILPLVRIAFVRIPAKRGETLLWALNSIYSYVFSLPHPENNQLDAEEMAILENCPIRSRLEECVHPSLDFCEPFISEAKSCHHMLPGVRSEQINNILSFLLSILDFPIAHFDMTCDPNKYMSRYYKCAVRVVNMINSLVPDTFWKVADLFTEKKLSLSCQLTNSPPTDKGTVNKTSVGVLAYLIWAEGMGLQRLPCVRTHEYTLDTCLPFLVALLKKSYRDSYLSKGIDLAAVLISLVSLAGDEKWSRFSLQEHDRQELYLGLVNAMLTCGVQSVRQKALQPFQQALELFEPSGQVTLTKMIFSKVGPNASQPDPDWPLGNGSGIKGWLIDFYRGQLAKEIQLKKHAPVSAKRELEDFVPELLDLFQCMKEDVATDLLDNFEQYMATLNLIRFLCLCWGNKSLDAKPQLVCRIKDFLETVRRALELSVAHYKLEMKQCEEEKDGWTTKSVSVIDREKANMLSGAINTFDLLSSLLARNMELIDPFLPKSKS